LSIQWFVARTVHARGRLGASALLSASVALLGFALASSALAGGTTSRAKVAGAQTINEYTYLRLTYVKGNRIAGRGSASGTVIGTGSANLTLVTASRAVGEFTGGNPGGSVRGKIVASYRVAGVSTYFNGTVTSVSGTGRYAKARSLGIKISGTMNRAKLTLTMTAAGRWQD
jgi:hypothetical protein